MHHRRERPVLHHVAAAGRLHADRLLQRRDVLARQRADPGRQGSRRQRRRSTPAQRRQAQGRGHQHPGHGADRRSGLDEDRHHDHRRLHAQHPDRRVRSAASSARRRRAGRQLRHLVRRRDSAENTYIVEGINTTDTGFGGLSSNLPNEFIAGDRGHHRRLQRRVRSCDGRHRQRRHQAGLERVPRLGVRLLPAGRVRRRRRTSIQREGGSIDTQDRPRLPLRPRRRARRSDHQGQAVVPRRLQPVVRSRRRTRIMQTPGRRGTRTASPTSIRTPASPSTSSSRRARSRATSRRTSSPAKINGAVNQNNQFQISAFGNPRTRTTSTRARPRNPRQTLWKYDDGAYDVVGEVDVEAQRGQDADRRGRRLPPRLRNAEPRTRRPRTSRSSSTTTSVRCTTSRTSRVATDRAAATTAGRPIRTR